MATISIDLDDKAAAGLKTLTDTLRTLGNESAELTQQQQQQITIVQQSTQDWKTFGSTVFAANAKCNAEVAKTIGKITELAETTVHAVYGAEEFAFAMGSKVVTGLVQAGLMMVKYTLLTKGAVSVIKTIKGTSDEASEATEKHGNSLVGTAAKATAFGVVLTTLTGQWNSVGEAAAASSGVAVKSLAVVGPVAAAASISLTAYEAIMSRTGKKSVGWTDDFSKASAKQIAIYEKLIEEANKLGVTVDEIAESKGIDISKDLNIELVEQFETNLDRVKEAASGLGTDIRAVGGELVSNLKEIALASAPVVTWIGSKLPAAWEAFDAVATRTADNNIKAINNMREALSGVTTEQREATAKLEAQRETEKRAYDAIRKVNATLAAQEKERARTNEIASITTVDGIEREMVAVKQRASLLVGNAVSEKNLYAELNALEQQKTRLIEAEEAKRKASLEKSIAIRRQYDEDYAKSQQIAQQLRVKQFQDEYDQEKKILTEFYDFRRNLVFDARNEDFKTAEALIKQSAEEAKARANLLEGNAKDQALKKAERDTEGALHALKMKNIDEEFKQKLAAAKSEDDTRKAYYDYERKRATAEAEFNRQVMVQKLQDRQSETDKAIAIEKAKQEALKKAGADALDKAGIKGQDLLAGANKKDVRNVLQEQARERARREVNAANADLRKEAEFDTSGPAAQKLARLQKQAQAAAAQDAAKQFARGKTDPTQLANAQAQVAGQMVQGFQSQGKLADTTAQALQQSIQLAAKEVATTADQQRIMEQLKKDIDRLNGAADANQQRARAQANSL